MPGRFARSYARVEDAVAAIAMAAMMIILFVVCADVFCRYVLNSPLSWTSDVVSRYLTVCGFYFSLAYTLRHGEHIRVLFFRQYLPRRLRPFLDFLIYLAACGVFGYVGLYSFGAAYEEWLKQEVFVGSHLWAVWLTTIFVAFGSFMFAVRLLMMAIRRATDIRDGRLDPDVDREGMAALAAAAEAH